MAFPASILTAITIFLSKQGWRETKPGNFTVEIVDNGVN
jgi:hypothetical protein